MRVVNHPRRSFASLSRAPPPFAFNLARPFHTSILPVAPHRPFFAHARDVALTVPHSMGSSYSALERALSSLRRARASTRASTRVRPSRASGDDARCRASPDAFDVDRVRARFARAFELDTGSLFDSLGIAREDVASSTWTSTSTTTSTGGESRIVTVWGGGDGMGHVATVVLGTSTKRW